MIHIFSFQIKKNKNWLTNGWRDNGKFIEK